MVREMSLIRGLGAPAKEMSFRHHLALFKDLSCPLLPTIARHCPLLPAKKMLQALVASQYGRGSRGPGRVPRAAPRQPGCTVEPTNHEPRSFLARGASQREFRGFHESRNTSHESRPLSPPGHCLPAQNRPAWRGFERLSSGLRGGEWGVSQFLCPVSRSRSAMRRAPPPGSSRCREHKMNPCRERDALRIPLAHQGDISALALHSWVLPIDRGLEVWL